MHEVNAALAGRKQQMSGESLLRPVAHLCVWMADLSARVARRLETPLQTTCLLPTCSSGVATNGGASRWTAWQTGSGGTSLD